MTNNENNKGPNIVGAAVVLGAAFLIITSHIMMVTKALPLWYVGLFLIIELVCWTIVILFLLGDVVTYFKNRGRKK